MNPLRRFSLTLLAVVALMLGACSAPPDAPAPPPEDAVDFSFVFFGCNRVGFSPHVPSPSTANVAQLRQTLEDITNLTETAGLPKPPRYLFFLGDLVRNEADDDGQTLTAQLAAWQTLWEGLALAGTATELVPVPGNHEVLASIEDPPGSGEYPFEVPNPPTYDIWLDWLEKNGYDGFAGNGPTPATDPSDHLARDSSRMTYSFSTPLASGKNAHFVLVNTDTLSTAAPTDASCLQSSKVASDPVPGFIPASWIESDVAAAQADEGTELVFAFGHKPIQAAGGSSDTVGRDNILNCSEYPLADRFQAALEGHDKVVAYLTAHAHLWEYADLGAGERTVPQIIAGDGGSPLSGGDQFGFTLVTVYRSGKVTATGYGRTAPTPYDNPESGGPATPQSTHVLREAAG